MEKMQKILEEDTRVNTALLPVGCGLQLTIKKGADGLRHGRRVNPRAVFKQLIVIVFRLQLLRVRVERAVASHMDCMYAY